jgi:hypothetical protein
MNAARAIAIITASAAGAILGATLGTLAALAYAAREWQLHQRSGPSTDGAP